VTATRTRTSGEDRRVEARRSGALDGLRGLAVAAVVLYHLGTPGIRGGLFGVDVFFVLSGYLITGLLLQEWHKTGTISLVAFWGRRARRLLPALLIMLSLVAVTWRFIAQPAELPAVRDDVLATLLYGANWHSIFVGHSYFAAFSAPSPLLHTWSLAVEEQFYLVWPLVAVVALVRHRSPRRLLLIAVVGAIASGALMAVLSIRHADPSRLYFGTDTRAQTLMIGAVLAIGFHLRGRDYTGRRFASAPGPAHGIGRQSSALSQATRAFLTVTGVVGAGVMVWSWLRWQGQSPLLYRGGLFLLAIAVDGVLAAVVLAPRGLVGRVLATRPLRVLGRISYGVYLFHWPVIVALTPGRTGLSGWVLDILRVVVTLVLATCSFVLVEQPIRERRWRIPRPAATVPALMAGLATAVVFTPLPSAQGTTLAALAHATPPRPPPRAPLSLRTATTTTKAPQVLAAAVSHPGPVRVMLEGDSVGWSLGNGIAPQAGAAGFVFANEGYVGCGIATGGQTSFTAYVQPPSCLTWSQRWQGQVATFRPDVTLVLLGRWELVDRVHDGAWEHIGQPDFDAYLSAQLETVVQDLIIDGGRVAFLTAPCNDEALANAVSPGRLAPDDASRVAQFNNLLAQTVARHPGVTELVPFADLVCPGGQFQRTMSGRTLRTDDGVHMEPYAGQLFVTRLMPQIQSWLAAPVLG
jgi:peptidoglycan/LPS O-acetylase OafA/YrhL